MGRRDFSRCLICDEFSDHLLEGHDVVVNTIKVRLETDVYDIMLQNTKACMKCIGRLQQLNDFCTQVEFYNEKEPRLDEICCDICRSSFRRYELITPDKFALVLDEIVDFDWIKIEPSEDQKPCSCFSCYEFVKYFNHVKSRLEELNESFHSAMNSCRVKLKDCANDISVQTSDPLSTEQEDFLNSLFLTREASRHVHFSPVVELIHPVEVNGDMEVDNREDAEEETEPEHQVDEGEQNDIEQDSNAENEENNNQAETSLAEQFDLKECVVILDRLPIDFVDPEQKKSRITKQKTKKKKKGPTLTKNNTLKIKLPIKSKQQKKSITSSIQGTRKSVRKVNKNVSAEDEELNSAVNSIISNGHDETENSELVETDMIEENNNSKIIDSEHESQTLDEQQPQLKESDSKQNIQSDSKPVKRKSNSKARRKFGSKKRKISSSKKQSKVEETHEVAENAAAEEEVDEAYEEYLDDNESKDESDESLIIRQSTEIEFLHPRYKNQAIKFENTSYEENDLITYSKDVNMKSDSDLINLEVNSAEFLEEDDPLGDLLRTSQSQISNKNDELCPIYTMDELLKEDSLVNVPA